jgi:hypothetical protein
VRRSAATVNTAFKVALAPALLCISVAVYLALELFFEINGAGGDAGMLLPLVPFLLLIAGFLAWLQYGLYKNNRDALFVATVVVGVEFYATAFWAVGLISPSGVPVPLAQFIFLASMALSIWIYLPRARRA